ncbi:hypothetical protein AAFF_G00386520 [Aldrovandia affinis]|uniref:Uncharacterized protein n=1 Tax=Aldrovandia affinis TaxID=143900 RepID=A0AAD7SH92_9TELE|nr:hypothetical protein AAFF_G00386520 [Aldrovandia affinis]
MTPRPAIAARVTAQKISKTITLYVNESAASRGPAQGGPKPLLLLFPWLASSPQALSKYWEIYFRAGFDVLVVETEISQFLWPRWGLDYGAKVLEVLQDNRFVSRPLLVHAFSIGGYTFTNLLVHISRDPQRYQGLIKHIKGQVYDSLVYGSLEHMAIGLGKTMFPQCEGLVRQLSLLYFRMFKRQTVNYFTKGIDVFRNSPVMAPALFFFCENDALCDHKKMEEVIEFWRTRGMAVESRKWKESVHARHLRQYPQEYLSTLEHFLCFLNFIPLRAKL